MTRGIYVNDVSHAVNKLSQDNGDESTDIMSDHK